MVAVVRVGMDAVRIVYAYTDVHKRNYFHRQAGSNKEYVLCPTCYLFHSSKTLFLLFFEKEKRNGRFQVHFQLSAFCVPTLPKTCMHVICLSIYKM